MIRTDRRPTRSSVVLAALVAFLALVAASASALGRAAASAADVPLSPLTAGWRVGANYPERRGVVTEGEVAGELDDVREFAGPTFDPDAVAPAVRDFYERTADYELAYEVYWHRPFRLGAALASRATSRIEQLNLPGPRESGGGRLDGRFAPVDPAADSRAGARAWVRTNEDREAVFVAIYGHHERDGIRYVNVAVPLPGGNLSTVLRPENSGGDAPEPTDGGLDSTTFGGGLELTTLDATGDEGLYLVTPLGNLALPLDQRFRVRPAGTGDPAAPAGRAERPASVVATHEMWLFGRQFLTIRYSGVRP